MEDIHHNGSMTKRMRRSAEQWSRLIEAHRDSGLSIKAFCVEHGLAVPHFHRWRRRLEQPGAGAASRAFVRLRVPADAMPVGSAAGVVVRFADGVELRVGVERLSELVALLRPRNRNPEPAGGVRRC